MTVADLIQRLQAFNPAAKVVVMSSHDEGDDVTDWEIMDVHDEWTLVEDHDQVSLKIDFDQRPGWFQHGN